MTGIEEEGIPVLGSVAAGGLIETLPMLMKHGFIFCFCKKPCLTVNGIQW